MSSAEVRFIQLMGGKVFTIHRIKHPQTRRPLRIVWTLGKTLGRENFKREVRYGVYWVDFANDLNRIIEIDGAAYHQDVVADMDRDIYIRQHCYRNARDREARIMRIPAYKMNLQADIVQQNVLQFIKDGRY